MKLLALTATAGVVSAQQNYCGTNMVTDQMFNILSSEQVNFCSIRQVVDMYFTPISDLFSDNPTEITSNDGLRTGISVWENTMVEATTTVAVSEHGVHLMEAVADVVNGVVGLKTGIQQDIIEVLEASSISFEPEDITDEEFARGAHEAFMVLLNAIDSNYIADQAIHVIDILIPVTERIKGLFEPGHLDELVDEVMQIVEEVEPMFADLEDLNVSRKFGQLLMETVEGNFAIFIESARVMGLFGEFLEKWVSRDVEAKFINDDGEESGQIAMKAMGWYQTDSDLIAIGAVVEMFMGSMYGYSYDSGSSSDYSGYSKRSIVDDYLENMGVDLAMGELMIGQAGQVLAHAKNAIDSDFFRDELAADVVTLVQKRFNNTPYVYADYKKYEYEFDYDTWEGKSVEVTLGAYIRKQHDLEDGWTVAALTAFNDMANFSEKFETCMERCNANYFAEVAG